MDKREDFGIQDFYLEFEKSKCNNFPSLSPIKEHQKVSLKLYKKIILKFLTIYFYDVYFFNRPYYFLLGGKVMLNRCGGWIRRDHSKGVAKTRLKSVRDTLGLFWHQRAISRFEFCLKLKKLTGSTGRLPRIEKEWLAANDVGELKTVPQLKEEGLTITNRKRICYRDYIVFYK